MNHDPNGDTQTDNKQLARITTEIRTLAQQCSGDLDALLSLLRTLEQLHREIREQFFEPSLPDTRKDLYHLLREIEETGGWPYIERMKLQILLKTLTPDSELPPER
ncbi:hypothetical protein [Gloeothece verrucosa]|uniref:Uncharacterized protein n=1 Tax=Gloeothece verrucosa (strain PCC 7822) TaxID=497965 RepID=E0UF94_GLOV7|nr:hypothetical protein [Gloeothece verrucosa]ADN15465.1 conserved hypothetical protein [Gloeothece verrucosa PCC 7822]